MENLKLLSYFIPNKFNFNQLHTTSIPNALGALYIFLKTDIHTYDIRLKKNTLEISLCDNNENKGRINELKPYDITELYIDNINNISFITSDGITYENCKLINVNYTNQLHAISCLSDGISDYMIIDTLGYQLYFVPKENDKMYEKLFKRL